MKGIIFTEFLEMVEETFGLEVTEQIIEESTLPSEGVYTSVGTYDFNEMVSLLTQLSENVDIPANKLLHTFGLYLFDSLGKAHPEVIKSFNSPIALLMSIEDHIHVHVKKLYPDAELPTFTIVEQSDTSLSIIYASSRGLYSLAQGLMEKCFIHFNSSAHISHELLKEDGTQVKFDIVQHG
ncbi:Haem-NO-binding [Muriicola jejuensis]|uniref:Heme NO-binding domain-containing protein n=1 Tax=Muriicola jejuensis TaxID=504488 RepID=A0A6P0UKL1_9FLAO|nr:heme NO-binding domain-containing protein [Muriicola jejuensis]NER11593.1 hypothetical protein [Muriicola jejuensis]SMP19420.1 Haem-NO-binding [Muriicola jejuensis]